MTRRRLVLCAAIVLGVVACGGGSSSVKFSRPPLGKEGRLPTPDAAFRAHAPSGTHTSPFTPPKVVEAKLANGVRVLVVEKHDFPIVTLRIRSNHAPDAASPGVGALWARSVFSGTEEVDSAAVYRKFAAHAIEFGGFISHEDSSVEIRMLTAEIPRAIEILGETLHDVTFPEKGVKRAKTALVNGLAERQQSRDAQLWDAGVELLYPAGHPYRSDHPSANAIKAVSIDQLVAYHHTVFSVERTTIVVAGDVTPSTLVPKLDKAFGWIPSLAPEKIETPPRPPVPTGPKFTYVDRPADVQALIGAWWVGIPMNDPDMIRLDFALAVLRAQLDDDLRSDSGFTYGVDSANNSARLGAPPIELRTAIERDHVGEAIRTILDDVRKLGADAMNDKIFAYNRDEVIDGLGTWFETTDSITRVVSILPMLGLPIDEYSTWPARLGAVKPDDLQRVAKAYVPADAVQFVIVGDEKTIRPQIEGALKSSPRADDGDGKAPDEKKPDAPPAPAP